MEVMNKVMGKIAEQGMYTMGRWNLVFVAPPLCINKAEVDEGMEIISKALSIADEYCV
jgi:taurine--2-oxoglutarate transaminase